MPYHSATISLIDIVTGESPNRRKHYVIRTQWSKHDPGHDGPAYTREDEDHKILRWDSNDAVVPSDIIEATDWEFKGEMVVAREEELERLVISMRQAEEQMSDDERAERAFEMRAAFGPGETVVNVITGKRYTT